MKVGYAVVDQPRAHFRGNRSRNELPDIRRIVQTFEKFSYPVRYRRAAACRELREPSEIGYRQDSGNHRRRDSRARHAVAKSQIGLGIEEELGDCPAGTRVRRLC